MGDWLDYEKLAAEIYRQLQPYATVKHNDKIYGHKTKTRRQIDVSIRSQVGGHEILIIVQAKNHKRPIDINKVGEFQGVIEDVKASKGVMICNSGFTETAIAYARDLSIDLCSLHDTQSPDWGLNLKVPLLWIEYEPEIKLKLILVPDRTNATDVHLPTNPIDMVFSDGNGAIVPGVLDEISSKLRDRKIPWEFNKPGHSQIPCQNLKLLLPPNYWVPIGKFTISFLVKARVWTGEHTLLDCRGIHNQVDKKLTAQFVIDGNTIPIPKDQNWKEVVSEDEIKKQLPTVLCIERWPAKIGLAFRLEEFVIKKAQEGTVRPGAP